MQINQQDARSGLFVVAHGDGGQIEHTMQPGRHAWVQTLRGAVEINGMRLDTSDGAAVSDEASIALRASGPAEIMLFDMA